ncbi:MAG: DUF2955 domain-containing protein [Gammaproteobacteria bacterium]|nr:DUF2955 domain-containing protein [Gammaproteobacteria bacterium]
MTHPIAARRILRLALGTALSLFFSQAMAWPLSFIAPVMTLLILALPLPAPTFRQGLAFVIALSLPAIASMALIPFLMHMRWVGILLMTLALFYSFYFTARGGSAILGTLITLGLTLVATIGSTNSAILVSLLEALAVSAAAGVAFVWIAHALLPDFPAGAPTAKAPAPVKPDLAEARRDAFRALLVVLPIALLFLFMSGSSAYTVMMIKVASMGQQASADRSAAMGRSLLESTLWGGVGAMIGWNLLSIWPALLPYTLLVGLAGLLYGRRIFQGPAMHPKFSMWSYAYMTALILLAPALMDSPASGGSGAAIWFRVWLFILVALYGTTAVAVFNAFWPEKQS